MSRLKIIRLNWISCLYTPPPLDLIPTSWLALLNPDFVSYDASCIIFSDLQHTL